MSITGLTSSGIDLCYIFQSGTTATESGYKLSNGTDLSSIFKENVSGTYALDTGYKMINNQDISTMYEQCVPPPPVTIANYDFAYPTTSTFISVSYLVESFGWNIYGGVNIVNNQGLTTWWPDSLYIPNTTGYLQYCAMSIFDNISQNITLSPNNYNLSFWIKGRYNEPGKYSINTVLNITINSTTILSDYTPPSTTEWSKKTVNFTWLTPGSFELKFEVMEPNSLTTTLYITGITIS
jgi:hypothetical protein